MSIPGYKENSKDANKMFTSTANYKYYMVSPFLDSLKKWIVKFKRAEAGGKERKSAHLKVEDDEQIDDDGSTAQYEFQMQQQAQLDQARHHQYLQSQYSHQYQQHAPPMQHGPYQGYAIPMQPTMTHQNFGHPPPTHSHHHTHQPHQFTGHEAEYHGQVPVNERVHLEQSLNKLLGLDVKETPLLQPTRSQSLAPVDSSSIAPSDEKERHNSDLMNILLRGSSTAQTDGGYKSDDEASDRDPKLSQRLQVKTLKKEFKPQKILKNPKLGNSSNLKVPRSQSPLSTSSTNAESLMSILVPKNALENDNKSRKHDQQPRGGKKSDSDSMMGNLVNPKPTKQNFKPTQILKRPSQNQSQGQKQGGKTPLSNITTLQRDMSRDALITQIVSPHSSRLISTPKLPTPMMDSGLAAALSGKMPSPSSSEKQSLLDILQGAPEPPRHNSESHTQSDELDISRPCSSVSTPGTETGNDFEQDQISDENGETQEPKEEKPKGNGLLELLLGGSH